MHFSQLNSYYDQLVLQDQDMNPLTTSLEQPFSSEVSYSRLYLNDVIFSYRCVHT